MEKIGDTALSRDKNGNLSMRIPARLGRVLAMKGYDRANVFVTEEGILLKPYRESEEASLLPESWV